MYRRLGYDPEAPKCLECRAEAGKGDTSVALLTDGEGSGVLKCLHGTCGGATYGPLALVSKVLTGDRKFKGAESTRKILGWFEEQGLVQPEERKRGRPARVYTAEEIAEMGFVDEPETLGDEAAVEGSGRKREQTDAGNAERLVDLHGRDIRFVTKWKKWIVWDGARWVLDDGQQQLRRLAKVTMRTLPATDDVKERQECIRWAQHSLSNGKQKAMIESAEHMCTLNFELLNRATWLLNTPSGTVDLRTGDLREHRREDYITQITRMPFDPNADRTLVDRFLEKSQPDPGMRSYLWRLQGYAASGDGSEHVIAFHYGPRGRNGKGTLVNSLMSALGDYATQLPAEVTMGAQRGQHPTGLATLYGKRFAVAPEVKEREHLNVAQVKALSGGDPIACRRMGEDYWSYEPTHVIQEPTNHRPVISGSPRDPIWERLHLVPWEVHIPAEERIKGLKEQLSVDPGLLRALVEGAMDYTRRGGLEPPDAVVAAVREYRRSEDTIGRFVEECLDVSDATSRVTSKDLYEAYRAWCESEGIKPLSLKNLAQALDEAGVGTPHRKESNRGRLGVRLVSTDDEAEVVEDDDEADLLSDAVGNV